MIMILILFVIFLKGIECLTPISFDVGTNCGVCAPHGLECRSICNDATILACAWAANLPPECWLCVNQRCTCLNAYTGSASTGCNTCRCSQGSCSSSGTYCNCYNGWEGELCTGRVCPGDCLNGGNCNHGTRSCNCAYGWSGSVCQNAICPSGCVNGNCNSPNHCNCNSGWEGTSCSTAICPEGCVNGDCVLPNTCQCEYGWDGDDCSIPICKQICSSHGECVAPDDCKCEESYSGERCDDWLCDHHLPMDEYDQVVVEEFSLLYDVVSSNVKILLTYLNYDDEINSTISLVNSVQNNTELNKCFYDSEMDGIYDGWKQERKYVPEIEECRNVISAELPFSIFKECDGVNDVTSDNYRVISADFLAHLTYMKTMKGRFHDYKYPYNINTGANIFISFPVKSYINFTVTVSSTIEYISSGIVGTRFYKENDDFMLDLHLIFIHPVGGIFENLVFAFVSAENDENFPISGDQVNRINHGSFYGHETILTIVAPSCSGFPLTSFESVFSANNTLSGAEMLIDVNFNYTMPGQCDNYFDYIMDAMIYDARENTDDDIEVLVPFTLEADFEAGLNFSFIDLVKLEISRFSDGSVIRTLVSDDDQITQEGNDMDLKYTDKSGLDQKTAQFEIEFTFGLQVDQDETFYGILLEEDGKLIITAEFNCKFGTFIRRVALARNVPFGEDIAMNAFVKVDLSGLKPLFVDSSAFSFGIAMFVGVFLFALFF